MCNGPSSSDEAFGLGEQWSHDDELPDPSDGTDREIDNAPLSRQHSNREKSNERNDNTASEWLW